jgi:hypothetical protein
MGEIGWRLVQAIGEEAARYELSAASAAVLVASALPYAVETTLQACAQEDPGVAAFLGDIRASLDRTLPEQWTIAREEVAGAAEAGQFVELARFDFTATDADRQEMLRQLRDPSEASDV